MEENKTCGFESRRGFKTSLKTKNMGKYQIKKAGIGMKVNPSNLKGRVFQNKIFGLSYIMEAKPYAKDNVLGYPAMLITNIYGRLQPHIAYVHEDAEIWAGEITTKDGKKVSSIDTTIYF